MTTKEETFIDKTGWVDGPWMGEPDRVEWRSETAPELVCLIVRGSLSGSLCGYVGLPPGHPWHGKDYGDDGVNPDVHGGLTYAASCSGHICHVPEPGEPDEVWWLGFDAAHGGDYSYMIHGPNSELQRKLPGLFGGGKYEPPPAGEPWYMSITGTYRDLAYMRAEVESLAEQCAAVARD